MSSGEKRCLVSKVLCLLCHSDGAFRSGLFCALCDVISRVKYDRELDVYTTVRKLHVVRPQSVDTQVTLPCHYVPLACLTCFHSWAVLTLILQILSGHVDILLLMFVCFLWYAYIIQLGHQCTCPIKDQKRLHFLSTVGLSV